MTRALVIAEHSGSAVAEATLATIAAAGVLAPDSVDVAILAADGRQTAAEAACIAGVGQVLLVERPENAPYLAAIWAPQIAELAADYSHVFAPATTFGKDLMPRAAATFGTGIISDICAIDAAYRFRRPIYAGNAIAEIEVEPGPVLFATVRPTAFERPSKQPAAPVLVTALEAELPAHTRVVGQLAGAGSGPELQSAKSVVAGGRGMGGETGVALIRRLAASLGAAVGASRAAVDAGWMGNDLQVGQTGKVIAPALYIGVGISGAIQHLTGIRDAGTVVAINQDPEAPICKLADIVLVADLFEALPEMIEQLEKRSAASADN